MPKCPLCETELEKVNDNEMYCPKDDMTLKISKGRLVVTADAPDKKGKIQDLEEKIAELQLTTDDMKKRLFGNKDLDLFGI